MRATEPLANAAAKQRLRAEINSQINEYLRNGGEIEVLGERFQYGAQIATGRKPASAALNEILNPDAD